MTSIDKAAIDGLAAGFQGQLIQPDDPTYDSVRQIWNTSSVSRRSSPAARVWLMSSLRFDSPASTSSDLRYAAEGTRLPAMPSATPAS